MVENLCESFVTYFVLISNAFQLVSCSVLIQTAETTKMVIGIAILPFPLIGLYGIMSENLKVLKIYFSMVIVMLILTTSFTVTIISFKYESKSKCLTEWENHSSDYCSYVALKKDHIFSFFIFIFLFAIFL